MAKDPVRKEIDDCIYEFFPMAPKPALQILTRLSKLALEPLGLLGDALKNGKDKDASVDAASMLDKDMPQDVFAKVAKSLVERLDEDQVYDTIERVVKTAHIQTPADKGTRPIQFEKDFMGRPGHLLKVFVSGLEVHYSDFFGAGGVDLGALAARAKGLL